MVEEGELGAGCGRGGEEEEELGVVGEGTELGGIVEGYGSRGA